MYQNGGAHDGFADLEVTCCATRAAPDSLARIFGHLLPVPKGKVSGNMATPMFAAP